MTAASAMRLLIITGIFPPDIGGPATYVPQIASALAERGKPHHGRSQARSVSQSKQGSLGHMAIVKAAFPIRYKCETIGGEPCETGHAV